MKQILTTALAALASAAAMGQQVIDVDVSKPLKGAPIQSTMYGIFFEDINFAADGGLYAEMVKNRSFEFPQSLLGWKAYGNVEVMAEGGPFERNPHYVRLSYAGHAHKHTGIENEGFFGISVEKGKSYNFSVYARSVASQNAKIRVEIADPANMGETQVLAMAEVAISGNEWAKYTATLSPDQSVGKGVLRVYLVGADAADVEHVSLFPSTTWKNRENGLRADLAQALADLHPGVFRFPGGCIVEGTDLESRYQWKNSVGQVENRPLNENRWNYTFAHRMFPDYYQSYGLGFFEFFQLSEDIGAEPLPVLSCGLACQFQNDDVKAHVPVDSLDAFIQDALDLIEFANGDVNTTWGKVRADMGHPAPFNMKLIGIGNEQWDVLCPQHIEPFVKAIKAKYPNIKIIGTSGPDSEGKQFDYLWPEMKRLGADLVDEHFYRPETWFLTQGNRYDNYDRKGPKVFAGEYACHGKGKKWNHYEASLLEAAFMTGLERNADVVHMATYAPLFAHVEGWQWRPDMIWYDNTRSFRTASYYVQQLYSLNKGTNVLKTTMAGKPVAGNIDQNGLFASAVYDANDGSYIIKVVNVSQQSRDVDIRLNGLKKQKISGCKVTLLYSQDGDAENSLDTPSKIVPHETTRQFTDNVVKTTIPAQAFHVYRVNVAK